MTTFGFLLFVLVWFGSFAIIGIFVKRYAKKRFGDNWYSEFSPEKKRGSSLLHTYETKKYLLTDCELNFYKSLSKATPDHFKICPMVRLADVIYSRSNNYTEFNKINRKHIDFVICKSDDMEIFCCIELNDKSHQRNDRRKRDHFVRSILADCKIQFFEIQPCHDYDIAILKTIIFKSTQ